MFVLTLEREEGWGERERERERNIDVTEKCQLVLFRACLDQGSNP